MALARRLASELDTRQAERRGDRDGDGPAWSALQRQQNGPAADARNAAFADLERRMCDAWKKPEPDEPDEPDADNDDDDKQSNSEAQYQRRQVEAESAWKTKPAYSPAIRKWAREGASIGATEAIMREAQA